MRVDRTTRTPDWARLAERVYQAEVPVRRYPDDANRSGKRKISEAGILLHRKNLEKPTNIFFVSQKEACCWELAKKLESWQTTDNPSLCQFGRMRILPGFKYTEYLTRKVVLEVLVWRNVQNCCLLAENKLRVGVIGAIEVCHMRSNYVQT